MAQALNPQTADHAVRVTGEHDLEQDTGRVVGCPRDVVLIAPFEAGQIELVVDQVVERVLECPGEELAGEVAGQQLGLRVDQLEAGMGTGRQENQPACNTRHRVT